VRRAIETADSCLPNQREILDLTSVIAFRYWPAIPRVHYSEVRVRVRVRVSRVLGLGLGLVGPRNSGPKSAFMFKAILLANQLPN